MMDNMKKVFETMSKEEGAHMFKMMESMPMMKEMYRTMCEEGSDMRAHWNSDLNSDINSSANSNDSTLELKSIFKEWLNQVKEEVVRYQIENPNASTKEISEYFKLSEQSVTYLIKSNSNEKTNNSVDADCETLKIKKTNKSCSLCEDYVQKNIFKSVVVASCEGACLRGEIARKTANILCDSIAPEKTVRLCLGSALTKEAGQRSLVKNAKKILVLEGCPVDCASRMISGLSDEFQPEVIHTDILADFDKNLFGIAEMQEDEINQQAYQVALKIAEKLEM